jgi:2-oxoglutarate dehydrogenase E2 component (dihydrolipoamide succinyltransferase)
MPQLGETVTEGTITRWMKQVGDEVAEDEVIFEVSTDKVDSEVPSPAAGVVTEILVPEGETVDVGTKLAVISDGATGAGSAPAAGTAGEDTGGSPEDAVAAAAVKEAADGGPTVDEDAASTGDAGRGPQAPAPEEEEAEPAGPEPQTRAPAAERRGGGSTRPTENRPPSRPSGNGGKVLSPVVRRLIAQHDLDPATIKGTGAGGRITRSDVLEVIDRQSSGNGGGQAAAPAQAPPQTPAPAPAPAAPAPEPAPPTGVTAGERDTVVPFTNIRRRTAEHMVRSKHTSAHTMVAIEVDYHQVAKVREAEKARFKEAEGFGLTYLPFIARATVDAVEEFPHVNASVGDNALVVHHDLNLGIAVDLDFEGLLVPVIHQADGKRLRQLARDISALAKKARSRKLTMDDISGGTFTVTNAGPFGTLITVPVINQPQVAILSTDGIKKRPVAVELPDGEDGIAVHPVGNLVLSWDHRAFDGAYAAAFLAAIKANLESRDWAAELGHGV